MQRARFNARENAPPTEVAVDHPRARGRERQGRRRQVVGHREPRGRARGARAAPSACSTPTSGASASRACSASTAASAATDGKIDPNRLDVPTRRRRAGTLEGRVDGLPRRRREHRAHVARPHPHQGARAVPHRRALGRARLPAHRHAARAPATSRWGWPACCPQAEMLVVTTPARAAQKVATRVADMARRSYMKVVGVVENMSEFVAPDGSALRAVRRGWRRRARRGDRRAARGVDPARARGVRGRRHRHAGRARARPTARPARRSTTLAARIVDDLLPPIEMAGCTARILDLVGQIDADATRTSPGRSPGSSHQSAMLRRREVAVQPVRVVVGASPSVLT